MIDFILLFCIINMLLLYFLGVVFMFKKNIWFTLFTSFTLLLSTSIIHNDVHADDSDSIPYNTKATLTFKQADKTDITNPVDPNNPNNPANNNTPDPGDPNNHGTGAGGPLSIDYAPNFDFGIGKISSPSKTYTLANADYNGNGQTRAHNPFVQITDNRGTGSGWNLSASISGFTNSSANPNNTLNGAYVTLRSLGNSAIPAYNNTTTAPEIVTNDIQLNGSSQNLMTANKNTGMGTWLEKFDPQKVTLTVPSSASAGADTQYSSTINWKLTTSPTSSN